MRLALSMHRALPAFFLLLSALGQGTSTASAQDLSDSFLYGEGTVPIVEIQRRCGQFYLKDDRHRTGAN